MNPLFADIGDIIGLLITLAIIGFSVLGKFMGEGAKPKQQAEQRRRRAQQKAANPQAKSIESEIEEFLRQARGDGPAPRASAPPVEAVVMEEHAPIRTLSEQSHNVDPVQPGEDFGRDLETHVAEHIGKDSISQRDAHLGETVEMADERIEHHLEEVFDHQVGHIAHHDNTENTSQVAEGTDTSVWQEEEKEASIASEIVELMQSPDTVRKMFIATEIFKRPEI